jgi:hypothetical protein
MKGIIMSEGNELLIKQKDFKAGLTIRTYGTSEHGDKVTYDEAIALLDHTMDIRESMGVFDPAHEYFVRQTITYSKLATAIAWVEKLDRKDHLKGYNVIWSFSRGAVTEEGIIWISKAIKYDTMIDKEIKTSVWEQLLRQGIDIKLLADLEVVRG